MSYYAYFVSGAIMLLGIVGMARSHNLVHAVVCLSVAQSATYVMLLAVGYQRGASAPIFTSPGRARAVVDPVVQAMTLTDIVVSAAVTSMLLALAVQIAKRHHTVDPDELSSLRG